MKKTLAIVAMLTVILTLNLTAQSFNEIAAGQLTVGGEKVGVMWVDPQSYIYPLRWGMKLVSPPDTYFTLGVKAELIKKGASVMVLNPPGMEKVYAPFLVLQKGQFNGKESLAGDVSALAKIALGANGKGIFNSTETGGAIPEGIAMVKDLMSTTEFSGEIDRLDQFAAFYKKILELWGITKLVTIESGSTRHYVVRGYDIAGASAGLVFQYYLKFDAEYAGKISTKVGSGDVNDGVYTIIEDAEKIKPESSNKRIYEVIKRVGEYFK